MNKWLNGISRMIYRRNQTASGWFRPHCCDRGSWCQVDGHRPPPSPHHHPHSCMCRFECVVGVLERFYQRASHWLLPRQIGHGCGCLDRCPGHCRLWPRRHVRRCRLWWWLAQSHQYRKVSGWSPPHQHDRGCEYQAGRCRPTPLLSLRVHWSWWQYWIDGGLGKKDDVSNGCCTISSEVLWSISYLGLPFLVVDWGSLDF